MDDELVVELTVATPAGELAADRLWASGATALRWLDGDGTVTLTASFPTPEAARVVSSEVGGTLCAVDGSWRDVWKQWAEPVVVGGLVVTPAWRDVPVAGGALAVRIDPAGTFGSGTHASTRLVLGELDRVPPTGLRVLDVGCGSGILSIAAALLGAAQVHALDLDEEAARVTAANAEVNGVGGKVRVALTPIETMNGSWDLALVNLTAAIHAQLGNHIARNVRPGGRLVLAGLLPGQWRHISDRYPGTAVISRPELEGWEGVILERRGTP